MKPDPRYPIGKFHAADAYTLAQCEDFLQRIQTLPGRLEAAIKGMTEKQLDTPYREGGWTVRQVIHHVADSHTNAYIRVKWALTEESPIIKAYDEKAWATTPETSGDPALSLAFLHSLHAKWVVLLKGLTANDLERQFIHPATQRAVRLDQLMAMYAWHGDHHLAHITELKKQKNWS
jgi:uncharacterized damage-inducible protein DinB